MFEISVKDVTSLILKGKIGNQRGFCTGCYLFAGVGSVIEINVNGSFL